MFLLSADSESPRIFCVPFLVITLLQHHLRDHQILTRGTKNYWRKLVQLGTKALSTGSIRKQRVFLSLLKKYEYVRSTWKHQNNGYTIAIPTKHVFSSINMKTISKHLKKLHSLDRFWKLSLFGFRKHCLHVDRRLNLRKNLHFQKYLGMLQVKTIIRLNFLT